ncbi:MAG: TetR/AcrR family transcriptional regulator [Aquihabitans sp.]
MITGDDEGTTGRERNPERSRERLLDAALTEFAEHGFAGARVEAIAKRSGLNKQLISHYFGGKRGLYDAVMRERRLRGGGELTGTTGDAGGTLAAFFDRANADPEWVRVLLWEALDEHDDDVVPALDERRVRYRERVAWVRAEQEAGRLPADLEPDLLLMTLLGAALYPVLLPDVCEIMTGDRPGDPAFDARYRAHLLRLAEHLGG